MALTLNQVINRIRTLALSHDQINHFYQGTPEEFDANGEINFPVCFLEIAPGSVSRSVHQTLFNFKIYFLDLVGVSTDTEGNETEVLSDMTSVMQDFLAMAMYHEYEDTWEIDDTANFVAMTEVLNDMAAGVVCDLQVRVDFLADRCQVPADDVTFEDIDMPRTKIYTYTADGTESGSFSAPTLSGKAVLAAWRSSAYKRVTAIAPTDTEKMQVGTVDIGSGKGILGDGTVRLTSGDTLLNGEQIDFLYYA